MSGAAMRTATILLMSALMASPAFAQSAAPPPLDYVAVPDSFSLPAGMTLAAPRAWRLTPRGMSSCCTAGPIR